MDQGIKKSSVALTALLVFVVTAILAGGGTYYVMSNQLSGIREEKNDLDNRITELEKKIIDQKDEEKNTASNDVIYVNEEGFQLTLPKAWQDYKVFKISGSGSTSYVMALPTNRSDWIDIDGVGKGYGSVFSIQVYSNSDWDNINNQEGRKPTYLGEKGDIVFAYELPNSGPSVVGDTVWGELAKSTESVIKSFRVN